MQTITIHDVKTIELLKLEAFESDKDGAAFNTRRLRVEDKDGNLYDIVLFSDKKEALTITADWNDDQSITL
jgi:hypothetical protein